MSTIYIFHEAGSIPGIPGTFAHCQVEVDENGEPHVTPLPLHPDPAFPLPEDSSSSQQQEKTADTAPDQAQEAPAQEVPIPEVPEAALDTPQAQEGA